MLCRCFCCCCCQYITPNKWALWSMNLCLFTQFLLHWLENKKRIKKEKKKQPGKWMIYVKRVSIQYCTECVVFFVGWEKKITDFLCFYDLTDFCCSPIKLIKSNFILSGVLLEFIWFNGAWTHFPLSKTDAFAKSLSDKVKYE